VRLVAGFSRLTSSALDLRFPLSCVVCARDGSYLCPVCEPELPRLEKPYCLRCAEPDEDGVCDWCRAQPPAYDGVRAPYLMEGAVRDMVHSLKYRHLQHERPARKRRSRGERPPSYALVRWSQH